MIDSLRLRVVSSPGAISDAGYQRDLVDFKPLIIYYRRSPLLVRCPQDTQFSRGICEGRRYALAEPCPWHYPNDNALP